MRNGWKNSTVGEMCALMTGGTPSSSERSYYEGGDINWVVSGDVHKKQIWDCEKKITKLGMENSNARMLPKDSVLIALNGIGKTRGTVAILRVEATCNQSIVCMSPKDRSVLSSEFLFHFLNGQYRAIREITGDKDRRGLNMPLIRNIEIPIPPIHEQQRIVATLDEAFAGLATATANAEKNLTNAHELFESYLNSIFSQRSGEWTTNPIGDVAEVFDGPHATPRTVEVGPVFLGISALTDGVVDLSETRHVTADDFKKWTRRVRPRADDVVFSYETRLGQAAIIPKGLDCCLGRRMGLVRCDGSKIQPRFFLYQYLAKPFQDFLRSRTVNGATVDRISIKEFPAFEIRVASLAQQQEIVAALDYIAGHRTALKEKYRRKVTALADLKQSILQKAFTGQLTASPVQSVKEAAE